ncbi:MAG: hypothetical protein J5744_03460 [Oscillospiraceae bacterium]|nr:hypothetical protein [Oscillospiraceae bacterium]
MRKQKYDIYLSTEEKRLLLNALIDERNLLIAAGRYTDAIDDLIVKITKARPKRHLMSA